jgi:conjugal transfer/entry exclusion protein
MILRFRAGACSALAALALLASTALTVTPSSAAAQMFGGGGLGGMFGGSGGGGCGGESDGLFGLIVSAAVGYFTGGVGGAAMGAGSSLAGGGQGQSPGCPIVESKPLMVEGMVQRQEVEIIAQTAHMLTQIDNMIRMRALSDLDSGGSVAARLGETRRAADGVGRVQWSLDGVDRQFTALYPDVLPTNLDAEELAAHQAEQARLARDASRASKRVSADVVTGIEAYPQRARDLTAALKACDGQTCAIDTGAQATLLNAEMAGQLLMLQAAHGRALEAQLDYEQAAVERARQQTILSWRGLDTYGAPGS